MLKQITFFSVVMLALSGCAAMNIDRVNDMNSRGNAFNNALFKEYRAFANSEAAQYDWIDADYFAGKAIHAANGKMVLPENPNDWDLPATHVREISSYHRRLSYMLNNGARNSSPGLAATAQAKFDCWVEQQEENWQPNDIAACRSEFLKAFADFEKAESGLAQRARKDTGPVTTTERADDGMIYFNFDSAMVMGEERAYVRKIARRAPSNATFIVIGHTDTVGTEAYNKALSARRANAVRQILINSGISADRIRIGAEGEEEPAVRTGDDVKEVRNRRASITVR